MVMTAAEVLAVNAQIKETERRHNEVVTLLRQADKRMEATLGRLDKLVELLGSVVVRRG